MSTQKTTRTFNVTVPGRWESKSNFGRNPHADRPASKRTPKVGTVPVGKKSTLIRVNGGSVVKRTPTMHAECPYCGMTKANCRCDQEG